MSLLPCAASLCGFQFLLPPRGQLNKIFWNGFTPLKAGRLSGCWSHASRSLLFDSPSRSFKTQVVTNSMSLYRDLGKLPHLSPLPPPPPRVRSLKAASCLRTDAVSPTAQPLRERSQLSQMSDHFFISEQIIIQRPRAKATFLKEPYEIISLCKSIKLASDSLSMGSLEGEQKSLDYDVLVLMKFLSCWDVPCRLSIFQPGKGLMLSRGCQELIENISG